MQIEIRGQHIHLDDSVKSHIERRLSFALGRFRSHILKVVFRATDVNGPKGGMDKQCKVTVELLPSGSHVVEDIDSDVMLAVDRMAERLGRIVEREVGRRQSFERTSARHTAYAADY